jgi:hypothetical protein
MDVLTTYRDFFAETNDPVAAALLTVAQRDSAPVDDGSPLKPGDVAKLLSMSPARVLSLIRSGSLKASNVATGPRPRYLIQKSALDQFLRNRQPEGPLQPSRRRPPPTRSKRY